MIRFRNMSYRTGEHQIFTDVSVHIGRGEFVSVLGSSGVGKSTILRLIHMEIFPTQGSIDVADYSSSSIRPGEVPYFRRKVGMIFQDFQLLDDRDVYENVAFALWATGYKRSKIKKRVFQVLAEVGLSHKRYKMIHELSGGEQQRVAIARALANEPFVLLADEPTGNLDSEATQEILQLLKRINSRGMTVVMATHKLETVKTLPSHILRIEKENLKEQA